MSFKKYYIETTLFAVILSPIIATIGLIFIIISNNVPLVLFISSILLAFIWFLYVKKIRFPDTFFKALMPIIIIFSYYMIVWILIIFFMSISKFYFQFILGVYFKATIPYLLANALLDFFRESQDISRGYVYSTGYYLFPFLQMIITMIISFTILITCTLKKKNVKFDKKFLVHIFIFLFLSCIAVFQYLSIA